MDRAEWAIAWRFARRVWDGVGELEAGRQAKAELGRPLPLHAKSTALRCRWDCIYCVTDLQAIHRRCEDRLGLPLGYGPLRSRTGRIV